MAAKKTLEPGSKYAAYDLDGDGKLNEAELLAKRADEDRLLNNQSISGWRKKKILDSRKNDEGEIKTY